MNDEDPKAVVPLGMSYKGFSSFYYVCVYEQKINVVALIVSIVQVPSTSIQYGSFYKSRGIPAPRLNTCIFFFLVQISWFSKYVLIKLVNHPTFTTVIGTLNTDIYLFT